MNKVFETYHTLLLQWQKTINLVAPSTIKDAWVRHFEDSIQVAEHISHDARTVCDIGSGAGFPGLIIAIKRPDMDVYLVESDTRKCAFLRAVSRETSTKNATVYNDRIENILPNLKCDVVTARALASLDQLIAYTQSQWRNNSNFSMILLKGAHWQEEVAQAKKLYDFVIQDYPSVTDQKARILLVGNIRHRKA